MEPSRLVVAPSPQTFRGSFAPRLAQAAEQGNVPDSVCQRCQGPMPVLRAVTSPDETAEALHAARPPPRPSPRAQLLLFPAWAPARSRPRSPRVRRHPYAQLSRAPHRPRLHKQPGWPPGLFGPPSIVPGLSFESMMVPVTSRSAGPHQVRRCREGVARRGAISSVGLGGLVLVMRTRPISASVGPLPPSRSSSWQKYAECNDHGVCRASRNPPPA